MTMIVLPGCAVDLRKIIANYFNSVLKQYI